MSALNRFSDMCGDSIANIYLFHKDFSLDFIPEYLDDFYQLNATPVFTIDIWILSFIVTWISYEKMCDNIPS